MLTRRTLCCAPALLVLCACGDDSSSAGPYFEPDAGSDASSDVATDAAGDAGDTAADTGETPLVPEFGTDATRVIRAFASVADGLDRPRDLQFDPDAPTNLWVASQDNDSILILFDAGTEEQTTDLRLDAFRNHFLEEVSSIAFGAPGTWASCQESRNTYDDMGMPNDFMGPALWPSALDVFARIYQNPMGADLGSHLDMLHQSPLCMGIAHYRDNAYFVFDGQNGHLVYYDFQHDHGPGQDDHSDGIVRRYPEVELTRVTGVPGHMEYDPDSNRLFIADTGRGRVLAFEVGSGEQARTLIPFNEPLQEYSEYSGARFEVFVGEGLGMPSGLAVHEGRLFVGDNATGEVIAYDLETGAEIDRVDTLAESLMGIAFGPDGKLWFVDAGYQEVLRLDP